MRCPVGGPRPTRSSALQTFSDWRFGQFTVAVPRERFGAWPLRATLPSQKVFQMPIRCAEVLAQLDDALR